MLAAAVTLVLGAGALGGVPAPEAAAQGSSNFPAEDFYVPPADLPATPGELVRAEPMPLALSVPGAEGPIPGTAERIMYSSTGSKGDRVAITGAVIHPTAPWHGEGPRPVAVLAPGTQGAGDPCAPSKSFATGVTIELGGEGHPIRQGVAIEYVNAYALVERGFTVVLTDLEGLGTPGVHQYLNRLSQGQATLDAARAVRGLPGAGISAENPLVLAGYSQGGGAVASAAELAPQYAPELDIAGVGAGAVPADLHATLAQIDGTVIVGAGGYAINSLADTYPEFDAQLRPYLSPFGAHMLASTLNECIAETAVHHGFRSTRLYIEDGRSAFEVVDSDPVLKRYVDAQRLGTLMPRVPVRMQHSVNDDAVPYGPARELARRWCAQGATVEFVTDEVPPILPGTVVGHLAPMTWGAQAQADYLLDRVRGVPAPNGCAHM